MITALTVVVILVFLVVVHEFGHFLAAKLFGVTVQEFGVGYPPRAFLIATIGGTEYTINWLPFGGFVRLFGDEGENESGRGSFMGAPRWKQGVILAAGVAMNAVAAWGLFAVSLHLGVPQVVDAVPAGEHAQLMVSDVVPASPADAASIHPGDEIVSVKDDKQIALADLTPDSMVSFVSERGGVPITITYARAGVQKTVTLTPANAVIPGAAGRPALGVALALVAMHSSSWPEALIGAYYETTASLVTVAQTLWSIVVSAFHGAPNLSDVIGPVGIVTYVGEASQNGLGSVLLIAALISVNLVVVNLIPIPALDGGRLVLLLAEAIRRRKTPKLVVHSLNFIGISLVLMLMVVVTYHDILRLLA